MKFKEILLLLQRERGVSTLTREKIFSVLGAFVAVFMLTTEIHFVSASTSLTILVVASMGATTCLVFVVPHSPMAQPWPMFGGHMLAALVGVACAQWISEPSVAVAFAVALAISGMYVLRCVHPPSAGTAMLATLGGPAVHALGWQFCYVVAINAGTILMLALLINNLIPGRRYPLRHTHHPHHQQFIQTTHGPYPELKEDDFGWALGKMDGVIDVSREDLVDIYEFAVEHAQQRQAAVPTGGKPQ
ncbi:MAG: HPP family protein [Methylophilaceae bacterium]|jgi:CBS domain-containing membrane protein|nr:hypothetical protein A7976_10720 [Methylobacillus sp. MM3]